MSVTFNPREFFSTNSKGESVRATNEERVDMKPPMETKEDGSLYITDFKSGVMIKSCKWLDSNDSLMVIFQEISDPNVTFLKFINSPSTDKSYEKLPTAELKKIHEQKQLENVRSLALNFMRRDDLSDKTVEILEESGSTQIGFKEMSMAIIKSVLGIIPRDETFHIKLAFETANGETPSFKTTRFNYFGTANYPARWEESGGEYDDIRQFYPTEQVPDNLSGTSNFALNINTDKDLPF